MINIRLVLWSRNEENNKSAGTQEKMPDTVYNETNEPKELKFEEQTVYVT